MLQSTASPTTCIDFNAAAPPPNNAPLPNCEFHKYVNVGSTDLRCGEAIEGFVGDQATTTTINPAVGIFYGCLHADFTFT